MGSWGEMREREGLQRAGRGASATMKDGRRLRQAGIGVLGGDRGRACGHGKPARSEGWGAVGQPSWEEADGPRRCHPGAGLLTVYSRLSAHRQFLEHEKPPHTMVARGLVGALGVETSSAGPGR